MSLRNLLFMIAIVGLSLHLPAFSTSSQSAWGQTRSLCKRCQCKTCKTSPAPQTGCQSCSACQTGEPIASETMAGHFPPFSLSDRQGLLLPSNNCDCGLPACKTCFDSQPTPPIMATDFQPNVFSPVAPAASCGCQTRGGCRQCRAPRAKKPCRKCPKCLNDVCTLKVESGKEKRTRYETEQDIICIPKVRLPWQKCNPCNPAPTCSKTRTITLLKKKSYECDVCKYTWEVLDPAVPDVGQSDASDNDAPPSPGSGQAEEPTVPAEVEEPMDEEILPITPAVPEAPPVPGSAAVPETLNFEYYHQAEADVQPLIYDRNRK